jgi:hypothetical protein
MTSFLTIQIPQQKKMNKSRANSTLLKISMLERFVELRDDQQIGSSPSSSNP